MPFCFKCGCELNDHMDFCPKCGTPRRVVKSKPAESIPTVAKPIPPLQASLHPQMPPPRPQIKPYAKSSAKPVKWIIGGVMSVIVLGALLVGGASLMKKGDEGAPNLKVASATPVVPSSTQAEESATPPSSQVPVPVAPASNGTPDDPCAGAENTIDMTDCWHRQYEGADLELNSVWKQLMSSLPEADRQKLKLEQRAWIAKRDATAEQEAQQYEGGTFGGIAKLSSLAMQTKKRIKELKALLPTSP